MSVLPAGRSIVSASCPRDSRSFGRIAANSGTSRSISSFLSTGAIGRLLVVRTRGVARVPRLCARTGRWRMHLWPGRTVARRRQRVAAFKPCDRLEDRIARVADVLVSLALVATGAHVLGRGERADSTEDREADRPACRGGNDEPRRRALGRAGAAQVEGP